MLFFIQSKAYYAEYIWFYSILCFFDDFVFKGAHAFHRRPKPLAKDSAAGTPPRLRGTSPAELLLRSKYYEGEARWGLLL